MNALPNLGFEGAFTSGAIQGVVSGNFGRYYTAAIHGSFSSGPAGCGLFSAAVCPEAINGSAFSISHEKNRILHAEGPPVFPKWRGRICASHFYRRVWHCGQNQVERPALTMRVIVLPHAGQAASVRP